LALLHPTAAEVTGRASNAELFQLTKPRHEYGDEQLGYTRRWLANIVVSVAPEPGIQEKGMNLAEARAQAEREGFLLWPTRNRL
jgi:hypothetical protein